MSADREVVFKLVLKAGGGNAAAAKEVSAMIQKLRAEAAGTLNIGGGSSGSSGGPAGAAGVSSATSAWKRGMSTMAQMRRDDLRDAAAWQTGIANIQKQAMEEQARRFAGFANGLAAVSRATEREVSQRWGSIANALGVVAGAEGTNRMNGLKSGLGSIVAASQAAQMQGSLAERNWAMANKWGGDHWLNTSFGAWGVPSSRGRFWGQLGGELGGNALGLMGAVGGGIGNRIGSGARAIAGRNGFGRLMGAAGAGLGFAGGAMGHLGGGAGAAAGAYYGLNAIGELGGVTPSRYEREHGIDPASQAGMVNDNINFPLWRAAGSHSLGTRTAARAALYPMMAISTPVSWATGGRYGFTSSDVNGYNANQEQAEYRERKQAAELKQRAEMQQRTTHFGAIDQARYDSVRNLNASAFQGYNASNPTAYLDDLESRRQSVAGDLAASSQRFGQFENKLGSDNSAERNNRLQRYLSDLERANQLVSEQGTAWNSIKDTIGGMQQRMSGFAQGFATQSPMQQAMDLSLSREIRDKGFENLSPDQQRRAVPLINEIGSEEQRDKMNKALMNDPRTREIYGNLGAAGELDKATASADRLGKNIGTGIAAELDKVKFDPAAFKALGDKMAAKMAELNKASAQAILDAVDARLDAAIGQVNQQMNQQGMNRALREGQARGAVGP